MTDDSDSDKGDDSIPTDTVSNPFAAGVIDDQLFESLDALQSVVAENDTAMKRMATLLSEESMTDLQQAAEVLNEYDDAIWTTHQLGRLFDDELSTQIEDLAVTVRELGELNEALLQNPVTVPNIDLQLIDPELLDLMVTDFATGPVADPLVEDSFDVEPEQDDVTSITPEEWVEMGLEVDMIITCDECGAAVLQQNSHRFQQQEDGSLVCPRCGTTGRGIQ